MTSNPEKSFKTQSAKLAKQITAADAFIGAFNERYEFVGKMRKANDKLYDIALYLVDRDAAYAICNANHAALNHLIDVVLPANYDASIEAERAKDRNDVRAKADRLVELYGFIPEGYLSGFELGALRSA